MYNVSTLENTLNNIVKNFRNISAKDNKIGSQFIFKISDSRLSEQDIRFIESSSAYSKLILLSLKNKYSMTINLTHAIFTKLA